MDLHDRLEIYIPVEAEVKSFPLWSLPSSVLKHMGLHQPDSNGSRKLTDSPEAIRISPVVIRRKGQKPSSGTGVRENMSSLLVRKFQASMGSIRMSFVSCNREAYKLLKDTKYGKEVSAPTSHTSLLPQASAPQISQDTVVIYQENIYLSIRRPKGCRRQKRHEPKPASQSATASTSNLSSKHQMKVRDVSSSSEAPEEAATWGPTQPEPLGTQEEAVADSNHGECEMQELGANKAESTNQNDVMNSNVQINSGDVDSSHSWTRTEPLGAAGVSISLQREAAYNELAQEERIAQLRAKLKQKEAALNFPSL